MIKRRILSLFRIKHTEVDKVILCCFFGLLIGAVQNIALSVPLGLFLSQFSIKLMPYIYIGTAGVSLLLGRVFDFFHKSLTFVKLMIGTISLMAISIFTFWLLVMITQEKWIIICLMICGWIIFNFSLLIIGMLLNQMFTLQEGKRLFGLVGASIGLGGVIIGLIIPLLSKWLPVLHLLLLTVGLLIAMIFILKKIEKQFSNRFHLAIIDDDEKTSSHFTFRKAIKNPYIILIFSVIILTVIEFYSLELFLDNEAQIYFMTEEKITSFFGLFFAANKLVGLLVAAFVLNRLLEKIGIISTLIIAPILVGLFMIMIAVAHFYSAGLAILLVLLIIVSQIDLIFHESINEQGLLLLYQPLKPAERSWTLSQNETMISPLATGLIGIILLVVVHFWGVNILGFAAALFIVCLLQIIILTKVKHYYLVALQNALTKHALIHPDFSRIDKENIDLLVSGVTSEHLEEAIYALDTLEKNCLETYKVTLNRHYRRFLQAVHVPIYLYILTKISKYKLYQAADDIYQICQKTQNDEMIVASLMTFVYLNRIDYLRSVCLTRFDFDSLKLEIAKPMNLIDNLMNALISSDQDSYQLFAAKLLKYLKGGIYKKYVTMLLVVSNEKVKAELYYSINSVISEEFYPLILKDCQQAIMHDAARHALMQQSNVFVQFVSRHFKEFTLASQKDSLDILRLLNRHIKKELYQFLLNYIHFPQLKVPHGVIDTLRTHYYFGNNRQEITLLKERLTFEANYIQQIRQISESIIDQPPFAILQSLLGCEISAAQHRILNLLIVIYSTEDFMKAQRGFNAAHEDNKSYAIEILFYVLQPQERELLIPVLTDSVASYHPAFKAEAIHQFILDRIDTFYVDGIPAAMVYAFGLLNLKEYRASIEKLSVVDNAILKETCAWALQRFIVGA